MKTTPTHAENQNRSAKTRGRTIPWAGIYDPLIRILSLGHDKEIRADSIAHSGIKPGHSVLDVGCGTGDLTIAAREAVGETGEVFGVDAAVQMVRAAKRKAAARGLSIPFSVEALERMSFPDNRFDVVLASLVMHHLPGDLKDKALAEIFRVLKPGGRVFILEIESSVSSLTSRFSDWFVHLHGGHKAMKHSLQKLVPILERAGFTDIETGAYRTRQLASLTALKSNT